VDGEWPYSAAGYQAALGRNEQILFFVSLGLVVLVGLMLVVTLVYTGT
jgi:hypothetical protein